jgi:hypothetical protein
MNVFGLMILELPIELPQQKLVRSSPDNTGLNRGFRDVPARYQRVEQLYVVVLASDRVSESWKDLAVYSWH